MLFFKNANSLTIKIDSTYLSFIYPTFMASMGATFPVKVLRADKGLLNEALFTGVCTVREQTPVPCNPVHFYVLYS